ncbi:hypothetical protein DRJ17_07510 [Candidatus Woesearchaeota archaeon]|nr:MAG: hypothetical protein DRJ17_07510 [Candidatus Woesearchaeota archaeon]
MLRLLVRTVRQRASRVLGCVLGWGGQARFLTAPLGATAAIVVAVGTHLIAVEAEGMAFLVVAAP